MVDLRGERMWGRLKRAVVGARVSWARLWKALGRGELWGGPVLEDAKTVSPLQYETYVVPAQLNCNRTSVSCVSFFLGLRKFGG